jgi:NADH:ubiquinone oxidoreductase subunit K
VTIGGSAALIIIGAILRFAVTWTPKNVDLQVIGVILMIGGAAGLCVAIALMAMRRRDRGAAEVTEQRRYVEPPR